LLTTEIPLRATATIVRLVFSLAAADGGVAPETVLKKLIAKTF